MSVMAVVGAQWGDEGKGKVVDELASRAGVVVRYQGGANAGHRVLLNGEDFTFSLVPAGILHPGVTSVIGNGVVVDPRVLLAEMEHLKRLGVALDRLFVSDRAHVVMPYHLVLDRLEEDSRGVERSASPARGIGPAYVDKFSRVGIRMADLLDVDHFRSKLSAVLAQKNRMISQIYGQQPLSLEEIHTEYVGYAQRLRAHIVDTQSLVQEALAANRAILLEGAQGALLDVDFGTYPFVTSSSTVAGTAAAGAGLPARAIEHVLGIYKAYSTRVGTGPMPTELFNGEGDALREAGHEFDAATRRGRRCGWFDAVAGRYVATLNGFDTVGIMLLDVLDRFPTIKIATSYRLGGRELHAPPANLNDLAACEPTYEEWPGWQEATAGATRWSELPERARAYLRRLEALLETPLALVSVGPGRGQTVWLRDLPM